MQIGRKNVFLLLRVFEVCGMPTVSHRIPSTRFGALISPAMGMRERPSEKYNSTRTEDVLDDSLEQSRFSSRNCARGVSHLSSLRTSNARFSETQL